MEKTINTTMTTGQIAEFLRAAVEKKLTPDRMTKIISSGALHALFDEETDLQAFLLMQNRSRFSGEFTLSGQTESFDPEEYFEDDESIKVLDGFRSYILSSAEKIGPLPEMEAASHVLVKDMYGDIRHEILGYSGFENTSIFCLYLAGMIERQINGGRGALSTNSKNVFYVRGYDCDGVPNEIHAVAAIVWWDAINRMWLVDGNMIDHVRLPAGSQVFSEAT